MNLLEIALMCIFASLVFGLMMIGLLTVFAYCFREDPDLKRFPDMLESDDCAPDIYVERVREKLLSRSQAGVKKYGTNLERQDLTVLDWLHHAQQECMDFANYLEVLIDRAQREVPGKNGIS